MQLGFENAGMVPHTRQGGLPARTAESGLPGEQLALLKFGGCKALTDVDQRNGVVLRAILPRKLPGGES